MTNDKAALIKKVLAVRNHLVLETMCEHAPSEMDALGYGKRRCVLATRVAVETLARYGIVAEPLEVEVVAANKSWLEVAARECSTEADFLATDAHMIQIDTKTVRSEKDFPGHLVARIVGEDRIVDLNTGQFKRPTILVPDAAVFNVGEEFFASDAPVSFFSLPNGSQLGYKRIVDGVKRDFRDGPDWCRKGAWFPVVRNLCLRIDAKLPAELKVK